MTLNEIKDICRQYKIVPTKSKGQNFLFDETVAQKIIAVAALSQDDLVLEIGPGLGVLTDYLIKSAGQVVAVELDQKLSLWLKNKYCRSANLKIVTADILKSSPVSLGLKQPYKIVANLPYNITSYFIRQFLENDQPPSVMTLMVQKEVAQRLTASSGNMSLLSLSVQFYAEPEMLFTVGRDSFWPSPQVDSAVVSLKIKDKPAYANPKLFFQTAKIGFAAKRKQLHNNLTNGYHLKSEVSKNIIKQLGLSEKIRAQDLTLENWLALTDIITSLKSKVLK